MRSWSKNRLEVSLPTSYSGTLTQKLVDAVHVLPDSSIVLSESIDDGSLGGLTLRDQDLVRYDPGTLTASLFLDGGGLFDA